MAERLPAEPVVVKPEEAIGRYGGSLVLPIEGQYEEATMLGFMTIDPLTMLPPNPSGGETIPNVAKGWDITDEGRTITFYLREGIKWSDGVPFTADDLLFWYGRY